MDSDGSIICSNSNSSSDSDDEYYDNFAKYKAKKAMQPIKKKKIECVEGDKDFSKNPKSDGTIEILTEQSSLAPLAEGQVELSSPNLPKIAQADPFLNSEEAGFSQDQSFVELGSPSPSTKRTKSVSEGCTINISSKGQLKVFYCDLDEPIKQVIEEYAERTNENPKSIILYTKQYKRCYPTNTPRDLGASEDFTKIELDAFEEFEKNKEKMVKLKYQMKGKKPITASVLSDSNFALLKTVFCDENGLDPAKTQFIFDSVRIADNETPLSLSLEDGDCVDVYTV